jgi:hypothetical protein
MDTSIKSSEGEFSKKQQTEQILTSNNTTNSSSASSSSPNTFNNSTTTPIFISNLVLKSGGDDLMNYFTTKQPNPNIQANHPNPNQYELLILNNNTNNSNINLNSNNNNNSSNSCGNDDDHSINSILLRGDKLLNENSCESTTNIATLHNKKFQQLISNHNNSINSANNNLNNSNHSNNSNNSTNNNLLFNILNTICSTSSTSNNSNNANCTPWSSVAQQNQPLTLVPNSINSINSTNINVQLVKEETNIFNLFTNSGAAEDVQIDHIDQQLLSQDLTKILIQRDTNSSCNQNSIKMLTGLGDSMNRSNSPVGNSNAAHNSTTYTTLTTLLPIVNSNSNAMNNQKLSQMSNQNAPHLMQQQQQHYNHMQQSIQQSQQHHQQQQQQQQQQQIAYNNENNTTLAYLHDTNASLMNANQNQLLGYSNCYTDLKQMTVKALPVSLDSAGNLTFNNFANFNVIQQQDQQQQQQQHQQQNSALTHLTSYINSGANDLIEMQSGSDNTKQLTSLTPLTNVSKLISSSSPTHQNANNNNNNNVLTPLLLLSSPAAQQPAASSASPSCSSLGQKIEPATILLNPNANTITFDSSDFLKYNLPNNNGIAQQQQQNKHKLLIDMNNNMQNRSQQSSASSASSSSASSASSVPSSMQSSEQFSCYATSAVTGLPKLHPLSNHQSGNQMSSPSSTSSTSSSTILQNNSSISGNVRVASPTNAQLEELNTKELAQKISSELKRYSIPQAVFAQKVLCRSQGTLSDLLRNPKPWSKLKSGRETFRRMWKWLQEPEAQRMNSLRLAGKEMEIMMKSEFLIFLFLVLLKFFKISVLKFLFLISVLKFVFFSIFGTFF